MKPPEPQKEVRKSRVARILLGLGISAYLAVYLVWTLRTQARFATYGFDLGIHDQAVWLLSHGRSPFVTVSGTNYFGDHLYWIMALAVPLYRLFPSANTLLVLQTLALGLAALPAFLVAREKLRDEWLACGLACAYLLNPYIQWVNRVQFHPDVFAVPLVLLAFWFAMRRSWRWFFAMIVLMLLVKEDVPLLVIGLGVWVIFTSSRWRGIVTAVLGALWLFINLRVLIPVLNGTGSLAAYISAHTERIPFGGIGGFFRTLFTRPWRVISYLFSGGRATYYLEVFTPLAFLPWLSPSVLAAVILPLLANGLSAWGAQHSLQAQYGTLVVSGLVVAAVFGIAHGTARVRRAMVAVMLVCALGGLWLWGPLPGSRHPATWPTRTAAYLQAADQAMALIPPDAVISVDSRFTPHLDHRVEIYEFPNPWLLTNWGDRSTEGQSLPERAARVQYVLFCRDTGEAEITAAFDKLVSSGEFHIVFEREGIVVARRVTAVDAKGAVDG